MSDLPEMERPWLPSRGIFGRGDGATALVVLLWGGIFLLVPPVPMPAVDRPTVPVALVAAIPSGISDLPLALRPDLIALPSAVSFGADMSSVDSHLGVPRMPIRREFPLPVPTESFSEGHLADPLQAGRIAFSQPKDTPYATAVQILPPVSSLNASSNRIVVLCSKLLGQTAIHSGGIDAIASLFAGKPLDAEISIRFEKGGVPVDIFLESSQGDPVLVQELLRRLWNPAMWQHASGQGRISIRYVPKIGGMNANTSDNMGAR